MKNLKCVRLQFYVKYDIIYIIKINIEYIMQSEGGLRMKVIQRRTKNEDTKRVECKGCGSILEIVASDITRDTADCPGMMEGSKMTVWYYSCPCCSKKNYLNKEDLPKGHSDRINFD